MTDISKIDLRKASISRFVWLPEYQSVALNPNGWLIGVTLENDRSPAGYMSGEFQVTDHKEVQIFGSFYWEYAMHSSGIIFSMPMANFNSAIPYRIRRMDRDDRDGPILPVIVSSIGCW